MTTREKLIQTAMGKKVADIVLKNAKILNVFTGEILSGDIAVIDGIIAGIGQYDAARQVDDLAGRYVVPGFVNAHCHVESSMVAPGIYIKEELRWGTTTLITDPHEVANVAGVEGIRFMLDSSRDLPINYYVQAPSCVPATPFEHSGTSLDCKDIAAILREPEALGLGEMMNYPGVLSCDETVMAKLESCQGGIIDGHAPSLTGKELQAYIAAGISTDHESVSFEEACEKLRAGLAILVREGSACKNLEAIIKGAATCKMDTRRMAFCTDDKHIVDIHREGTISHCIRRSIAIGLEPADAYRIASYNAAQIYGLKNLGAIAPGYRADMVVVSSLEDVDVQRVYKDGRAVEFEAFPIVMPSNSSKNSVHIAKLNNECLSLPKSKDGVYPVVGIVKNQIVTKKSFIKEEAVPEALKDGKLCKLAVIERHNATGNIGLGLLAGYGLKDGAVASTVGHDSHNLIVAGTNDNDMLLAVREIQSIQGGYVFVQKGKIVGTVPLPIYGLMSDDAPEPFINKLEKLIQEVHGAGVDMDIDPFITLSFLALPVIPEIRVTDMGIFDVEKFQFI